MRGFAIIGALALAMLGALTTAPAYAAATLGFGNFAVRPGDGAVTIEIEGQRVASNLSYAQFAPAVQVASGAAVRVRVLSAEGAVLLDEPFPIYDRAVGQLLVAGNGGTRPFEVFLAGDRNNPIYNGTATLQIADLAPLASGSGVVLKLTCAAAPVEGAPLAYGVRFGADELRVNGPQPCQVDLARVDDPAAPHITGAFTLQPGGRYWLYATGDGVTRPLDFLVQTRAVERTVGIVTPSAQMDGLWYDPEDAGTGLAITFNPQPTGTANIQAIRFGFDPDGHPRWNTVVGSPASAASGSLELGVLFYEYFGTTINGVTTTTREFRGDGTLVFHSCTEATLYPTGDFASIFGLRDQEHQTVHLVRLLPLGGCNNPQFG
jgi:hypothetical protein